MEFAIGPRMSIRSVIIGVLAASTLLTGTRFVFAMAAPPCVPATITPRPTSVPANLPAFGYDALKAEAKDVKLTIASTKALVPLTVGPVDGNLLKVAPANALVVGTSYELTYASFCSYGATPDGKPIVFTVTPAAPIPNRIADASASAATVTVKDYGTSKFTVVKDYTLAPEMLPWLDVYELALLVDGRAVETKKTVTGSAMQVTATGWCDAANAAANPHRLQLRAKLPFSPTLLDKEISESFSCPAPKITTAPPSNPTAPTPGANPNPTPGSSGTPSSSSSDGVSTCSAAPPRVTYAPFFGVAIGLALVSLRRRFTKGKAS